MTRRTGGFVGWLIVVAAAGLAVRLSYVYVFRTQQIPLGGDAIYYNGGANLFAAGRGFIEPIIFFKVVESASHPPLYVLFLSLASLVWPDHAATQLVHMVWTCVLGTGSVVLIGLVGREMLSDRIGLIAAGLAAVYPNLWVHDGMLLSESMAIFMVALILLLSYRFLHRPTVWRLLGLGIACGFGALARSELLFTVPVLLAPLVVFAKGITWQKKVVWLVAGGVAAAVVLAPWVGYNLSRFNSRVILSTNVGGTMAAANCDSTYYGDLIGYKDYSCAHAVWVAASKREPNWDDFDYSQLDEAVRAESMRYVKSHLSRLPVVVAARWGRIVHAYRPFQEVWWDSFLLKQERWVGYSIVWSFWLLGSFAVAGFVVLRRQKIAVWPLLAFPLIVLVSVGLTFAQTRYRAPAEVSIVLLAAVAIDAAFRATGARRRRTDEPAVSGASTAPGSDEAAPELEPSSS